eukprot:XP_011666807.1 PREDICTED: LOW QUALITY PROTEIN: isoleucine--tRNA ligase, cytoplasmic [Strongylocentrotus purpuratus]
MVQPVPDHMNFPQEEEKILQLWKELDAFQSCLKQSKGKPRYSFYDGPPFATGLPHYGHILAGTIKDVVTRYGHQSGFHVDRRFGWDCHGLPIEYEIDKKLGITGPEDVAKMGIEAYNNECRKIVSRYAGEWEQIITRLGRWIDFKKDYKTLYPWYMESVWWVFKQLFDKGMVYRGFKVMPYSTACNTPLSNFESGQNYKDVVDPAVIVSFPLDDEAGVSMIAWTTTPWTLPSNLALCVNAAMDYVKIKHKKDGKVYIMMEARLGALFKKEKEYEIMAKFKGDTLKGRKYQPLFPYFAQLKKTGAFKICTDGYVTNDSGTGVVHQAAFFGQDDYRVCLEQGIISKEEVVCPVDASGRFTSEVTDFAGEYVKDADKNIIKKLKELGRLVDSSNIKHSYPFCWRSDTPLIYKAVPSWFIRVETMSERLLANNETTYWVPGFVKEKRFANWLRDAHDWAISRNRYFGTPIPLWVSEDLEEIVCVGSIQELNELTGVDITDLHRESVDKLTIPSKRPGKPPLRRVSEVFDCWFESGSMPYAQLHYPFENKKEFEDSFPANFIAEGIDQTRGCFSYAFQQIITRLGRWIDFKKDYKTLYPWYMESVWWVFKQLFDKGMVYRGFKVMPYSTACNTPLSNFESGQNYKDVVDPAVIVSFPLDDEAGVSMIAWTTTPWTLPSNLALCVNAAMDYVKIKHKKDGKVYIMMEARLGALFKKEKEYEIMAKFKGDTLKGRKYQPLFPYFAQDLIDSKIETAVSNMQTVIELARVIRDRATIPTKYPLKEVVVINTDQGCLDDIRSLEKYVIEELNVRKVTTSQDKGKYHVSLHAEPDHMILGKRLKGEFKKVSDEIRKLTDAQLQGFISKGEIEVVGHVLGKDDLRLSYNMEESASGSSQYQAHSDGKILVLLDVTPDQSMLDEGAAREVINRIQKLRKKANLMPTDAITIFYNVEPASDRLTKIIPAHEEYIFNTIKQPLRLAPMPAGVEETIRETFQLKGPSLELIIARGHQGAPSASSRGATAAATSSTNGPNPYCKFVNVELCDAKPTLGATCGRGTVLLENPPGDYLLTVDQLTHHVGVIFGLHGKKIQLYRSKNKSNGE